MRLDVHVVLAALSGAAAGQGSCFVPNGTERHLLNNGVNDTYRPCSPLSEGHGMCCNTQPGDRCWDDGLCWNPRMRFLWRESCTDQTWESPRCLKLCINDEARELSLSKLGRMTSLMGVLTDSPPPGTGGYPSSQMDVRITECPDGSLCCGKPDEAIACCTAGTGKRIADGQVVDASASASSPAPSAGGGSGSSVDMRVVGGSVAGAVDAGVLALGVAFHWYRRRKRRAEAAARNKSTAGEMRQGEAAGAAPTELPPDSLPPAELPPDAYPRAEAPSGQR
ncbi:hypothetical protein CSOJ01_09819 [Colletotrichum sojae]|uniref:Uncharacterized protein n=1 Tax=Colletotrichum sojae TaxID=2175907 RepID=A0A8H6MQY5_9PEZI|nr:hypothetical protein CSOJ01_09819 [Colletotrichum sojae]